MSGSKLSDVSVPRHAPEVSAGEDQPLGLTVHSMPSPGQAALDDTQRTSRGRWRMTAVMLICAAPVIASYFTYYVIRPEGRRNYGELINPQRSLPDLTATSVDGKAVNLRQLKGQWLLVSVGGGACDKACRQHLYLQRQLRESLGKEKDRVDWLWLVTDDAPVAPALVPALKGATVLRVAQPELARWLEPANGQPLASHLYVIDPIGNWMMRFPAGLDLQDAAKAKRDLERLLRASASWDEPGR
ncbi:MAG: hypothetical protein H7332_12255 [Bdellovibrionales bacterium]|nr:hypothetical protein [Ramlibacter sp.]